ncbi:MAG: trigger factor [Bdellovibrionales bacterium]
MSQLDKLEGLNRKLTIEVPKDKVEKEFNEAYNAIKGQVTLPGFRKGKAPISKIKNLYKDKVHQEVLQRIVQESYTAALQEHDAEPISMPRIDFDELNEEKDFVYSAEFEIRPEVKLSKYEGLKVQKEKFVVDDSKVDEVLENMQNSKAENTPVLEDRPAKVGDIAKIDFEGFIGGEPLEGGAGTDFDLELGSNSFIPGFEEGIVGMAINGTTQLNLKFPDDYHAADIAGKEVQFKVTLKGLQKKSLPAINDEFAKSISPEFDTLEALKQRIKEDMLQGETQRIEDELKSRILRVLVKENPVDVPASLFEEQKQKLIQDTQGRMAQQGMAPDQFEEYKQKWDADFSETSRFMIQSSFLIDALANELEIKASAEDVDNKIKEYAQQMGLEVDKVKQFYNSPERRSQLSFQITEDRVVKYLKDSADITEVDKDQLEDIKV